MELGCSSPPGGLLMLWLTIIPEEFRTRFLFQNGRTEITLAIRVGTPRAWAQWAYVRPIPTSLDFAMRCLDHLVRSRPSCRRF